MSLLDDFEGYLGMGCSEEYNCHWTQRAGWGGMGDMTGFSLTFWA
jgi:hypothetical protein